MALPVLKMDCNLLISPTLHFPARSVKPHLLAGMLHINGIRL
jgi:hypothetical protein